MKETERVTVSGDGIHVYEHVTKAPPNTCQCGCPKSFHVGGSSYCYKVHCPCMKYVDVAESESPIRRRVPLAWIIIALAIGLLIGALATHAQTVPPGRIDSTRILLDSEAGGASGLGYHIPDLDFGVVIEQPIKTRWEAQGAVKWSPDRKYITNDGNSLLANAAGLLWLNRWAGATGGVTFSRLWTSQFDKTAWAPTAGVAFRDRLMGAPGRFYIDYAFPEGCQWATPSNPCLIQSNRLHGVEAYSEFRFFDHWRVGFRFAWWRFANQGNENEPMPRVWNSTGTTAVVIRYELRGVPGDKAY